MLALVVWSLDPVGVNTQLLLQVVQPEQGWWFPNCSRKQSDESSVVVPSPRFFSLTSISVNK